MDEGEMKDENIEPLNREPGRALDRFNNTTKERLNTLYACLAASFFQVRLGALVTMPCLSAAAETRM